MAREIDHIVMPVADLGQARARLLALGFTVAADASHPFGTKNACVFLKEGQYLEPLAIGDAAQYSRACAEGNAFVRRDEVFRKRYGQQGFSAVAGKTHDADADHHSFVEAGLSGGDAFSFSRPVTLPDGSRSEASFRLAFAAEKDDGNLFLFTCERVNAFSAKRSDLTAHKNGATGLREITLRSDRPDAFAPLVEAAFGVSAAADSTGNLSFLTPGAIIRIVHAQTVAEEFDGAEQESITGLFGAAVVFAVADLAVTESFLAANGVEYTRKGSRLLVQRAPGQGAIFAFEE